MCNCVRKCVGFRRFPQFMVILPVKRFAGDSRAKSPLPSHKKAPAGDFTTSLRAARFDFTRSGANTRVVLEKPCYRREGTGYQSELQLGRLSFFNKAGYRGSWCKLFRRGSTFVSIKSSLCAAEARSSH